MHAHGWLKLFWHQNVDHFAPSSCECETFKGASRPGEEPIQSNWIIMILFDLAPFGMACHATVIKKISAINYLVHISDIKNIRQRQEDVAFFILT